MDAADLILEVGEVAEGPKDGLVRRQGPDSGRWQGEGQPSTDSGGNRRRERVAMWCVSMCVSLRGHGFQDRLGSYTGRKRKQNVCPGSSGWIWGSQQGT